VGEAFRLDTELEELAAGGADARDGQDIGRVLRWCLASYPRVGFSASFGGTGIVIAHVIGVERLGIPIYFLDTGFLFPETHVTRQRFVERYGLQVIDVRPALSVEEQATRHGPELFRRDPDLCCAQRKVEPMQRVLASLDAWVSGLRRDQAETRGEAGLVEQHTLPDGRVIAKVHSMAHWTRVDAWRYIMRHDLPYNTLADRGYKSIGCMPCTKPVADGVDERAGRWAGTGKVECGLHTFTRRLLQEG
jgi:phosphoadenosine phosphosulfate reductase